jgi:hypothetical protein
MLPIDDDTPSVIEQALDSGWNAGLFGFGKAMGPKIDYFNPGLVERKDGLWLIARRAEFESRARFGKNSIWAFLVNPDDYGLIRGHRIKIPTTRLDEQFEDPRAILHGGKTWVSCCNFIWFGSSWSGGHQIIVPCTDDWIAGIRYDPNYGKNGSAFGMNTGHEKNWLWFEGPNGKLHLLYRAAPWTIVEFDEKEGMIPATQYLHPEWSVTWDYGEIRGGTPPVLVGNEFWTFFHSSVPWQGNFRRYHVGILAFESKPPFRPKRMTKEPIFTGSQNDRWMQRKPLVCFPGGALLRCDTWLISFGVNDLDCGWAEIPHEDILILATYL